jgi:diguanylate cyclase (GGDEF)-like protein/PAS domain S-box-containing protein
MTTSGSDPLGSLNQPEILEAEPAEALDRVTELARRIFEVPSVTLNLVAEEREWFKAASGVDLEDPEHGTAFGAFVLLDADLLVVEDATEDGRFADHPLVDPAEAPRFFAGAPLVVDDGRRVGALCLTDDQPRSFDDRDRTLLSLLADVAADTLETRRHAHQIDYLVSALEEVEESVVITEGRPIEPPGPRVVWANDAFTRLTGYERDEIVGESLRVLQGPETDPDQIGEVWTAMREARLIQIECINHQKDGTAYVAAWNVAAVRDDEGHLTHWVSVQRDITDQKAREKQLTYEATHDELTDLYNRKALARTINEALANEDAPLRALLYLDLDNFKAVNDTFGHPRGDKVLIRAARALESAVRDADLVARIGGDEFAVYLSALDAPDRVPAIAARIHDAIATTVEGDGTALPVRPSLGGVVGIAAYDSFEDVLEAADAAMYEAKENASRTVLRGAGATADPLRQ